MDSQLGEILAALEESGAAQDTLVLFTSEQGSQFPGNKWTCWDTGLHTTLIARWPGKVAEGGRTGLTSVVVGALSSSRSSSRRLRR